MINAGREFLGTIIMSFGFKEAGNIELNMTKGGGTCVTTLYVTCFGSEVIVMLNFVYQDFSGQAYRLPWWRWPPVMLGGDLYTNLLYMIHYNTSFRH